MLLDFLIASLYCRSMSHYRFSLYAVNKVEKNSLLVQPEKMKKKSELKAAKFTAHSEAHIRMEIWDRNGSSEKKKKSMNHKTKTARKHQR